MNVSSYLDFVKIQSKNLDTDLLSDFYKENDLIYHVKESSNPFVNSSFVTDLYNPRIIFETNYTSKKYEYFDGFITKYDHFINFIFAGTKTHKRHTDKVRNEYFDKVIDLNKINNVDYGVTELHVAFDIKMDIKKFNNLFPIRVVVHTFRHTVLSHLGMKGNSEFLIKKISNHKSTRILSRYVKLDNNSGRKEIENLWD